MLHVGLFETCILLDPWDCHHFPCSNCYLGVYPFFQTNSCMEDLSTFPENMLPHVSSFFPNIMASCILLWHFDIGFNHQQWDYDRLILNLQQ